MDSGTPRLPRARPASRRRRIVFPLLVLLSAAPAFAGFLPAAAQRYAIGEPTAEEQHYLELINRARANPAAEAERWRNTTDPDVLAAIAAFGVNVDLMASQLSALPPAPPLAFNAQLLEAARRHTRDQFTGGFQSHLGSDGSNPGSRILAAGYPWATYGENVYAAARSVSHGHAAFEMDWGTGPGGMLSPPGHRQTLHNPAFREIGVAVTNGFHEAAGPQVVTQDLAARSNPTPFLTGVVHYDLNQNGEYDPGEGLGGVIVHVTGTEYYAVTSGSGGYAVPVPGNGLYTVTFSAPALPPASRTLTVTNGANMKADWRPAYQPPVLAGPTRLGPGQPATFSFTPVGGAPGHEWKQSRRRRGDATDDAESGTNHCSVHVSPGYAVVQAALRTSGSTAFRLAHPQPTDQSLLWQWRLRPGPQGRLDWSSRLGWATASQIARVQATTNEGRAWLDLWTRTGTGDGGQAAFERVTVSLASLAGHEMQLRFLYDHAGGIYFNQTSVGVGWYFDDLRVSGCEQLVDTRISNTPGTDFTFTPAPDSDYVLRVRALTPGGPFEWGPLHLAGTTGTEPVLVVRFVAPPLLAADHTGLEFTVEGGTPLALVVETAPGPAGPWIPEAGATVEALADGERFRARCPAATEARRFYRVTAR